MAAEYLFALTGAFSGIWYLLIRVLGVRSLQQERVRFFYPPAGFYHNLPVQRVHARQDAVPGEDRAVARPALMVEREGGRSPHILLCCMVQ